MTETIENRQNEGTAAPAASATLAVGVQFHTASKIYTYTSDDPNLKVGERVVVDSEGSSTIGEIISAPHEPVAGELPQNVKKILRRATAEEIAEAAKQKEQALEYFLICQEKIRIHRLQMKLVDAGLEEKGKKAVFIFYAEQRVDFRNLVKDLASSLHMRIELRQVGARDESKFKGCLGPCGLMTCCSLYLRQFQSISISMAKHQGLAPNPAKLTGMCGKLKCCLAYEHEVYDEYRKDMPKTGAAVSCPHGAGKVTGHNVLKRECTVRLFSGGDCRSACGDCKVLTAEEREAAIKSAREAMEASEERSVRGRRNHHSKENNNSEKNKRSKGSQGK